ncbi:hypothetical protein Afil01_44360 [Actinorhabdospora filicis]|uniref:Uncharacterized protein n=1 Tax=Actinorhabdospora filicis TaxID=1785913 RepID=A0A9W6SPH0_9ACTN|nr:hypothetical protein [Actinorhabdospora filicis]GLZ79629.1 hypothetical protein Afil01_44360 [Actinorhabdospora filicis]
MEATTTPVSPDAGTDLTPVWIGLAAAVALLGLAIVIFGIVRATRRKA